MSDFKYGSMFNASVLVGEYTVGVGGGLDGENCSASLVSNDLERLKERMLNDQENCYFADDNNGLIGWPVPDNGKVVAVMYDEDDDDYPMAIIVTDPDTPEIV